MDNFLDFEEDLNGYQKNNIPLGSIHVMKTNLFPNTMLCKSAQCPGDLVEAASDYSDFKTDVDMTYEIKFGNGVLKRFKDTYKLSYPRTTAYLSWDINKT